MNILPTSLTCLLCWDVKLINNVIPLTNKGRETHQTPIGFLTIVMIFDFTDKVEESEEKGFLDLMRNPSMLVFFLALVVVQFSGKGQESMQSEWVSETVSCTNGTSIR